MFYLLYKPLYATFTRRLRLCFYYANVRLFGDMSNTYTYFISRARAHAYARNPPYAAHHSNAYY